MKPQCILLYFNWNIHCARYNSHKISHKPSFIIKNIKGRKNTHNFTGPIVIILIVIIVIIVLWVWSSNRHNILQEIEIGVVGPLGDILWLARNLLLGLVQLKSVLISQIVDFLVDLFDRDSHLVGDGLDGAHSLISVFVLCK